ncbi:hypothetical protein Tco_0350241 [Tanacetum coccineum]
MRQRPWLELLSDYNCEIRYRPGKANVVADALSRKERDQPLRVRALVMTIGLKYENQRTSRMKMLEECWLKMLKIQRRSGRKSWSLMRMELVCRKTNLIYL